MQQAALGWQSGPKTVPMGRRHAAASMSPAAATQLCILLHASPDTCAIFCIAHCTNLHRFPQAGRRRPGTRHHPSGGRGGRQRHCGRQRHLWCSRPGGGHPAAAASGGCGGSYQCSRPVALRRAPVASAGGECVRSAAAPSAHSVALNAIGCLPAPLIVCREATRASCIAVQLLYIVWSCFSLMPGHVLISNHHVLQIIHAACEAWIYMSWLRNET